MIMVDNPRSKACSAGPSVMLDFTAYVSENSNCRTTRVLNILAWLQPHSAVMRRMPVTQTVPGRPKAGLAAYKLSGWSWTDMTLGPRKR